MLKGGLYSDYMFFVFCTYVAWAAKIEKDTHTRCMSIFFSEIDMYIYSVVNSSDGSGGKMVVGCWVVILLGVGFVLGCGYRFVCFLGNCVRGNGRFVQGAFLVVINAWLRCGEVCGGRVVCGCLRLCA